MIDLIAEMKRRVAELREKGLIATPRQEMYDAKPGSSSSELDEKDESLWRTISGVEARERLLG